MRIIHDIEGSNWNLDQKGEYPFLKCCIAKECLWVDYLKFIFFLLENLFQMMDFQNIQFSLEEYLPLREKQHLLDFFLVRNKKYERVRV